MSISLVGRLLKFRYSVHGPEPGLRFLSMLGSGAAENDIDTNDHMLFGSTHIPLPLLDNRLHGYTLAQNICGDNGCNRS